MILDFVVDVYFTELWVMIPTVIVSVMLVILWSLRLVDRCVPNESVGLSRFDGCLWDNAILKLKYLFKSKI